MLGINSLFFSFLETNHMKNPGTSVASGPLPCPGNAELKMICSKRINKGTHLSQLALLKKAE
jgi:hypothetical protein